MVNPVERLRDFLTKDQEEAVTQAVQKAEEACGVEFRVAIIQARGRDLMKLAARIYRRLGVGKGTQKPGLLVLVLPVRREFVLWGDEKVNAAISEEEWRRARDAAIPLFKEGKNAPAIIAMLQELAKSLAPEFPPRPGVPGKLPDKPVRLD